MKMIASGLYEATIKITVDNVEREIEISLSKTEYGWVINDYDDIYFSDCYSNTKKEALEFIKNIPAFTYNIDSNKYYII